MFDVGNICLMELPLSDGHEQTGQCGDRFIGNTGYYNDGYIKKEFTTPNWT